MKRGEIQVRNIVIGGGMPKVCIPIVAEESEAVMAQAEKLRLVSCDMAEWRLDWYEDCRKEETLLETLAAVRRILGDMPLVATFRTAKEGGRREIGFPEYAALAVKLARSGMADIIDIEGFSFGEISEELIREIQKTGAKVLVSNHDFKKTPPKEELMNRLLKMQEMGADIAKLAVMPQEEKDVLTLMAATEEMVRRYATIPIVTMSMSGLGGISRLAGEIFGSAVTFASAGHASAPGQMDVEELRRVLKLLHESL